MIERFQNEFAAAALSAGPSAPSIQDRGKDAMIIAAKPTAAGQPITTSDDFRTVRPVTSRISFCRHFVAIAATTGGHACPGRRKMMIEHMA